MVKKVDYSNELFMIMEDNPKSALVNVILYNIDILFIIVITNLKLLNTAFKCIGGDTPT